MTNPTLETPPDVEVITLPNPDDMVICEWQHSFEHGTVIYGVPIVKEGRVNGMLECGIVAKWMGTWCEGDAMPVCDNGKLDIEQHQVAANPPIMCPYCFTDCTGFRPL
jgi:hypothetical protein